MTDTLARTGLVIPSNDGSDSTTQYRILLRALGQYLESSGLIFLPPGTLASRPAAAKVGRVYKPTDAGLEGILYYDNGTSWDTLGAGAATDPAANVGGLRTLGAGALQAAAGNHTHARDVFDLATPGAEAVGLASVRTTVTAGPTTITAGPASGRRIVKALLINAPTAGTSVSLTLAGVTIARLRFDVPGGGGDFALTLPVANGENLQATVTGGTATFVASYVDSPTSAVTRFGLVSSSGSGTLVASSGSARVVTQILVANPSTTTGATVSVTFAGTAILTSTPLVAGGLLTLDLPRPLPASQTITYAGDGATACTFLTVGH